MNFPSQSDVVRCASESGYPMDGGLHIFLVKLCECCGWDTVEVFRAIFHEPGSGRFLTLTRAQLSLLDQTRSLIQ